MAEHEGVATHPPDIIVVMTDEERAAPSYESAELTDWRHRELAAERWFADHAVSFDRHYTGSLACVPSRPTLFTGQYPDVHGVTQTDGLGKTAHDSRMRWLRPGEVPTLGNWFRAAGWDTHYDGKWHLTHADLFVDGEPLATNDAHGVVDDEAVARYLEADPLEPFGFSGWVGPEPHGGMLGNAGVRRDPLIAARVVAWLDDRYRRRATGDEAARRPFLLVASFVNPHDIVLFPPWKRRGPLPIDVDVPHPPQVPAAPTATEDLASKPGVQRGYRDSYPSMYGPSEPVRAVYDDHAQEYRDTYLRLHAAVDGPIERVRRTIVDSGHDALLVRTSDHGELLGAHGGMHQKWFQLYDEATRVPFQMARVGSQPTKPRRITTMPTSHIDLVPTLLAAAGIDEQATAAVLAQQFSEVHPLPGRNLLDIVDRGDAELDPTRVVYLMTRDTIIEGDDGLSALGRALADKTMRVDLLPDVATNIEGIVTVVAATTWKLVRVFDDPAAWSTPFVSQRTASGKRTAPLPDEWELYDLDADPNEMTNRADDPAVREVRAALASMLARERDRAIPERNRPWPYAMAAFA